MSADNWTACPRCIDKHNAAVVEATKRAENAYGKLPADEWKDLEAKAQKMAEADPPQTFREDYEIYGASEGVVTVSYSGRCTECSLSLTFKHQVAIETPTPEAPHV